MQRLVECGFEEVEVADYGKMRMKRVEMMRAKAHQTVTSMVTSVGEEEMGSSFFNLSGLPCYILSLTLHVHIETKQYVRATHAIVWIC